MGGTDKASVGYYGGLAFVANEATYARIGVNNSGTPQYWDSAAGGSGHEFTIYHSGNLTKSVLTGLLDASGGTYLSLAGGTMTGALTLKANQYSGLSGYGMNANNSDIVGVNSIYTEDLADDMGEGIHFFRSSGYWDSLTSSNGVLYYYPNRPTATTAFAYAYTIYHSGNSNKSDVAWACSNLEASGVIHSTTGIYSDGYVSAGGLSSSSDERLKTAIKDFKYSKDLLMSIRPREWDWNGKAAMKGHAAGFVAQEIEELIPYAVDNAMGYKALFYDQFHAIEIAGLQDHERRIRELENAVKARDKKIDELEKRLKLRN